MSTDDLVWIPDAAFIKQTNIYALMQEQGCADYRAVHDWSVKNRAAFWARSITKLGVVFDSAPAAILDNKAGQQQARWLPGAALNIAKSCFSGNYSPKAAAIITRRHNGVVETLSRGELDRLSSRVAASLIAQGYKKGDGAAIIMPMTAEAVAIYLGVVKAGLVVISVPDSVPPEQISVRLRLGKTALIFTQSEIAREGKRLPMYEKIKSLGAEAPKTVVLPPYGEDVALPLRPQDAAWKDFLTAEADGFIPLSCSADEPTNIIFSSGTTGDPKGIPWSHSTPIKAACDAHYQQDIRPGDVACWPTNLGWMMGPWLVYGSLMNGASIALYEGTPGEKAFGAFVQDAGVTMLGLVPSIVSGWRQSGAMQGFDWSKIRCFSSSGEASNRELYGWLMRLNQPAGTLKPVVEYCGGTEIGGGYISSTLTEPNRPAQFNAKVMGSDFEIRTDKDGPLCEAGQTGEVFIIPPSMGLSISLVGRTDHDDVYFREAPAGARWHGDLMTPAQNGSGWTSNGRAGNDLNLNGIKFGSTEIERAANEAEGVLETAAIGVPPPEGGADRLIIYTVLKPVRLGTVPDVAVIKESMRALIKAKVSPFASNVHDVVVVNELPRTASNKVMHRLLRAQYKTREA